MPSERADRAASPKRAAQKKPSRRVEQCVYIEGGRRCRRSGSGAPSVCTVHKIAFAEASRAGAGKQPGDGIYDLFDRIFTGKKVNRRVVESAIDDAAEIFGQHQQSSQASYPPPPPGVDTGPRPRNWWDVVIPPGARQQHPRQPPPPPAEVALKKRRQQARVTMGFTPSEALPLETVQKRRRELARKYHPDRPSGSVTKMQAINDAADVLEAAARA